jgi:hypothetical protein
MRSQKHREADLVVETIVSGLLGTIFHHSYPQHRQDKIHENNAWFVQIQQLELKRGLSPDMNALNVTSDFVYLVVFKIIIL